MPPKVKISKQEIIDAGIELIRRGGEECLNAREIAKLLGISTQPIFSNFENMYALRAEIINEANNIYEEYSKKEMQSGKYPIYKASGMAYIKFAKEEGQLFKLLFMRDRAGEDTEESTQFGDSVIDIVKNNTGLDMDTAKLFHLEVWSFVHGIATMIVTGYFDVDMSLVDKMVSDAYLGLKKQYGGV